MVILANVNRDELAYRKLAVCKPRFLHPTQQFSNHIIIMTSCYVATGSSETFNVRTDKDTRRGEAKCLQHAALSRRQKNLLGGGGMEV